MHWQERKAVKKKKALSTPAFPSPGNTGASTWDRTPFTRNGSSLHPGLRVDGPGVQQHVLPHPFIEVQLRGTFGGEPV